MADETQKIPPAVEKLIAEQTARFEAALAELGKLQSKGVAQMNALIEGAARVTQEQVAFAEQLGGEWRRLVLAATRSTADLITPKG